MKEEWAHLIPVPEHGNFEDFLDGYLKKNEKKYIDIVTERWNKAKKKPIPGFSRIPLRLFIDQVALEWEATDEYLFEHLNSEGCPAVGNKQKYHEKVLSFATVIIYKVLEA